MPRLSKAALFEMLGYVPHAGQVAVHRSTALRRVLCCGVRFGKTTCGAMEAVAAVLEPAKHSIGWVVGPTYQHADRIFGKVVRTVTSKMPHRVVEHSVREHRLLVRNLGGGLSEVWGKTADNPVSLLGEGLNWLIADEAARLKRDIWESHLAQRLIDLRGWALMLSTPRGGGWFCDLHRRGQRNRDPDIESWAFPSWANPHIARELIEEERKRLPPDTFAQEFEAEFIGVLPEPCDVCAGPDPHAPGIVVVHGLRDPLACPECGHAVDESGKSIVCRAPNGEPLLMVIQLLPGTPEDEVPPLPEPFKYAAATQHMDAIESEQEPPGFFLGPRTDPEPGG